MNAQQLKNSILQLAVQGKLVPQDPNDEPASKLVERIRAEKEKLIKEKKIKPDKNPSYIFRGSDNLPYEKVGKNEPICIAEEVPFDIPDSWEWVRLGSIGAWGSGATPSRTTPAFYGGDIPWLKTGDLNDNYITDIPEKITQLALEKTSVKVNPVGSVLIAMYGATIGKLGILSNPATTNQACCACLPFNGIFNKYLFYFLMAHKNAFIKRGEGGAQPNISKEKIVETLMPLPPLAEQKRIVAKIEELLPLVKEYDVAYEKIEKLNNNFSEQLKKSILQEAVQGKLVPQNPNDEPASVLIERIREEKQKLIQEKKIKKDKNESNIFRRDNSHYEKIGSEERCIDDEIPFDIPDSWEWVRLNSIVELITKGSSPKWQGINYVENNGILFLTSENVGSFSLLLNKKKFVETKFNDLSPRSILKKNDFLMNIVGASIGRTALFNIEETNANINQATCIIRIIEKYKSVELLNYLLIFFNSSICYSYMCNNLVDCARANLSMSNIANFLIPLPPLAEQQHIVEKIEQLLPKIKILQK